jgi:UDP-N-acetylglucosamine 2-epimerase
LCCYMFLMVHLRSHLYFQDIHQGLNMTNKEKVQIIYPNHKNNPVPHILNNGRNTV